MEPEAQGDRWERLRTALRTRCDWPGDGAWVEDALQEALLALLLARKNGDDVPEEAEVGFCLLVMRRRLQDRLRQLIRRGEVVGADLEQVVTAEREVVEWVAKLEKEGWVLSPGAREVLEQIQSGLRSTKGLARVIGRDAKTIRERRGRLMAYLRRVLEDVDGVPPPLSDFIIERSPEGGALVRATSVTGGAIRVQLPHGDCHAPSIAAILSHCHGSVRACWKPSSRPTPDHGFGRGRLRPRSKGADRRSNRRRRGGQIHHSQGRRGYRREYCGRRGCWHRPSLQSAFP